MPIEYKAALEKLKEEKLINLLIKWEKLKVLKSLIELMKSIFQ